VGGVFAATAASGRGGQATEVEVVDEDTSIMAAPPFVAGSINAAVGGVFAAVGTNLPPPCTAANRRGGCHCV
jgi:hypothetical protein